MESSQNFTFTPAEVELKGISSKERRDQLVQYNLDGNLQIIRFRFNGPFKDSTSDYESLVNDFVTSAIVLKGLNIDGTPAQPVFLRMTQLATSIMNMGFFDKLCDSDVVGAAGQIRGCFDETFNGITVGDKLREMMLNPDSENSSVFTDAEKNEFIFQLLRLLTVGGGLCQPDTVLDRYLDLTKLLYKDLITIYKDARTDAVQLSGRVYHVHSVAGLDLFPGGNSDSPHHVLFLVVDPLKKTITVVRNTFKSLW